MDRTAGTGKLGQDSWDWTAETGQPRQDSQDGIASIGQMRQDSWEREPGQDSQETRDRRDKDRIARETDGIVQLE